MREKLNSKYYVPRLEELLYPKDMARTFMSMPKYHFSYDISPDTVNDDGNGNTNVGKDGSEGD